MARALRADRLPVLVAASAATIYLLVAPRSVDLAAHVYRAEMFGRHGLAVWDASWYAGHHIPAYSVTFPPLAWLLGAPLAGAIAAVAATLLFARLVALRFGDSARTGPLWFAIASATLLFSGRLAFAAGVSVGLAALLAFARDRPRLATVLAAGCGLTSPIAALFLALAGLAVALSGARRRGIALGVAAAAPPLALAYAFPEGGYEPFASSQFWPLLALTLLVALTLPRSAPTLRKGAALYALATIAAFVLHTPMGGNVARLGELFGAPLVVCALRSRSLRKPVLLIPLAWLALAPAVKDVAKVTGDRSVDAGYYRPLLATLARAGGEPGRVEIPFTRSHWESAEVAPRFPLARGWERQLDIARNGLFYGRGPLTPATYAAWLSAHAVRWVAVAAAAPDYSAEAELRLIAANPSYLSLRWRSRDWKLYEFTGPHALIEPESGRFRLLSSTPEGIDLQVTRPGSARIAVAWSPYWHVTRGCVERDGNWTRVRSPSAATLRLEIRFSFSRVSNRGPRCELGLAPDVAGSLSSPRDDSRLVLERPLAAAGVARRAPAGEHLRRRLLLVSTRARSGQR
ncbi:MAG: hypothetical protein NVSMB25_04030 [Thermoleophilaceae bacterium]